MMRLDDQSLATPPPKSLFRAAAEGALWSTAFNVTAFVGGQVLALVPFGNSLLLELGIVCLLGLIPALAAVPLSAAALLIPPARRKASRVLLFSLAYVAVFYGCVIASDRIRTYAFTALARRSRPLVEAIRAYEAKHAAPPDTLAVLVPEFIPSVPKTGMGAYPDYQYGTAPTVLAAYPPGNAWVLYVNAPSGGINFDQFFYLPGQNYPERLQGDPVQRMEDWAYLHE